MQLGIELGMVINKDDPEGRKRVQVFIPHLSNTLFDNWNKNDIDVLRFKTPNDLGADILERLKASLPWAEAAVGIFGGGTSATVNTQTGYLGANNTGNGTFEGEKVIKEGETVDTGNDFLNATDATIIPAAVSAPAYTPRDPKIVEAPLPKDPSEGPWYNALLDPEDSNPQSYQSQAVDPQGNSGFPIDYNTTLPDMVGVGDSATDNDSKLMSNDDSVLNGKNRQASAPTTLITSSGSPNGTVSVPNEGAKVFVFFYGGDIQKPVYFASTVDY